jgi:hypothetical protein
MIPRVMQSEYMHFAKYGAAARYNLATSGVKDCVLADLGVTLDDLALHGLNAGGFALLIEPVALRFGLETAVIPGGGCSFANHLAFAALVAPGDEVLIEAPTDELMPRPLAICKPIFAPSSVAPRDAVHVPPPRLLRRSADHPDRAGTGAEALG